MPLPTVLAEPWLISESGYQLVLSIWSRERLFAERLAQAREDNGDKPLANDAQKMLTVGGVAVIPIQGTLMRHADMLTEVSGATSYASIRRDLRTALEDPAVQQIVLRIDSPGGEAKGCSDLAQEIRAATARKPVTAYVDGQACSAAYWLAAATGRIVCGPTAVLGSIGCVIGFADDSGAKEKAGIKEIQIVSSQSPNKRSSPVNDEVLARLQERADALAAVFIADVAKFRGVSPATVTADYDAGGVLVGAAALKAGLADRLGSLDGELARMAPRPPGPSARQAMRPGVNMSYLKILRVGLHGALAAAKSGADGPDAELCAQIEASLSPFCGRVDALAQEQGAPPALSDLCALRDKVVKVTGLQDGLCGAVDALAANAKAAAGLAESAQVAQVVEKMIDDGQIGPEERSHYAAYSLADAQAAQKLLRKAPPPQVVPQGQGPIGDKATQAAADAAEQARVKERVDRMFKRKGGAS